MSNSFKCGCVIVSEIVGKVTDEDGHGIISGRDTHGYETEWLDK